jgi:hypothetical protein
MSCSNCTEFMQNSSAEHFRRVALAVTDSALLNSESIEHALQWMKWHLVRDDDIVVLIYFDPLVRQNKPLAFGKSAQLKTWQLLLKYQKCCDDLGLKVICCRCCNRSFVQRKRKLKQFTSAVTCHPCKRQQFHLRRSSDRK